LDGESDEIEEEPRDDDVEEKWEKEDQKHELSTHIELGNLWEDGKNEADDPVDMAEDSTEGIWHWNVGERSTEAQALKVGEN
jgi:hypothetical protein